MNNRLWPIDDISPRALAATIRETNTKQRVSRNQLITAVRNVNKAELDASLDLLLKLGILEHDSDNQHYRSSTQGTASKDFLAVNFEKTVKVSAEGHRSVSLHGLLMALHDGVTERKCGSFVWRDTMPAPKYRLLPTRRWDPVNGNNAGPAKFDIEKRKKNDLVFKLVFNPPLLSGQLVRYGFYIWNETHYSRTRKEAFERYKDEWIREGLAILDPAIQFRISIDLPDRYRYQRAIVEKDPVLTLGGPNVPGAEISRFEGSKQTLDYTMKEPSVGHYFVSWIPPD